MNKFLTLGGGLCALVMHTAALAADSVDLIGTWKGLSNTTVMGFDRHHEQERTAEKIKFVKTEFTMVIDAQEGQNFSGRISSKNGKEIVLGSFSADMKGGVMVDNDGIMRFEMLGKDKFEHCYAHALDSSSHHNAVAACVIFTRQ